jgi:hypothetical protein
VAARRPGAFPAIGSRGARPVADRWSRLGMPTGIGCGGPATSLTRRYGDLVALDGLSVTVARGRRSGSSAPTGPARPPPCASSSACWSLTPAKSDGSDTMMDRMSKRVGHMAQDYGQTFSTLCAGQQRRILGQLGQQANHRNSRSGLRQRPNRRGRLRVGGRLGEGCGAGPRCRRRPARLPDARGGRAAAGARPWGGPSAPVQQPLPPAAPAADGIGSGCGIGDVGHAVILG